MPRVFLPPLVRELTGGDTEREVDGTSIGRVLENLESHYPGIRNRLCEGDGLRPGLTVAVNGEVSRIGLSQPVGKSSEIHFLPAVGGG